VRRERRSQWQFVISDDEGWRWEVKHADGKKARAVRAFPSLKECVEDAKSRGWGRWQAAERRRVITGRDALQSVPASRK